MGYHTNIGLMSRLQTEDVVGNIRRVALALLVLVAGTSAVAAQEVTDAARDAYFGAVAEFFELPRSEVDILASWRLDPDEIPVVLFVARRSGVSAEAVVALRRSGRGWSELAKRYGLDAAHFHVPLSDQAEAGALRRVYEQYRTLPAGRWSGIAVYDGEILDLVNLRVLAQTLGVSPEVVLGASTGGPWYQLYSRLIRDVDDGPSPEQHE